MHHFGSSWLSEATLTYLRETLLAAHIAKKIASNVHLPRCEAYWVSRCFALRMMTWSTWYQLMPPRHSSRTKTNQMDCSECGSKSLAINNTLHEDSECLQERTPCKTYRSALWFRTLIYFIKFQSDFWDAFAKVQSITWNNLMHKPGVQFAWWVTSSFVATCRNRRIPIGRTWTLRYLWRCKFTSLKFQ